MNRPRLNSEWSVVLFVVALLAFNPPVLSIFSVPDLIFGVPTLYLYIFVAWGGAIALLAANVPGLMRSADAPPRDGLAGDAERAGRDERQAMPSHRAMVQSG